MKGRIHALAQQLTGKQNLEECSADELKHLVQRYPYFAPAQFLLLQKLRQEGPSDEAEAQYKKAILYYPNPLQFEFFIASGKFFNDEPELTEEHESPVEDNEPVSFEEEKNEKETFQTEASEGKINEQDEPVIPVVNEDAFDHTTEVAIPEPQEEPLAETVESTTPETESIGNVSPDSATAPEVEQTVNVVEENETPSFAKPGSEPFSKDEPSPNENGTEVPAFEPYHTVDYFASQGIKVPQEELPKDKLGKQLKSFTEWLKTMKRLPASQMSETPESTAEKGVESMADRSVAGSEVVTEAMAEVWAKQGHPEKALDIYNKLVLLNPSKRAYFAAKIETLKQS